ncbi:hypothetical protein D4R75_09670 [bacterium]|nr:MAG: hypothetical protein D4R75_09670 [bacterium]
MDKIVDLVQLMRREFASSKRWMRYSILCNVGVVLLSVVGSIYNGSQNNSLIPLVLLFVQMIAFLTREKSGRDYGRAERIRRLTLVQDGLGIQLPDILIKRIASASSDIADPEPPIIGTYYTSDLPASPQRLLAILTESCFYTEHLSDRAFKLLATLSLTGLAAVVLLVISLIQLYIDPALLKTVTMVSVTFLSFWATGDLAHMTMKFRALHVSCALILDRCEELEATHRYDFTEIVLLLDEYNCALAASLPLPSRFYEARQARLDEMWSLRSRQEQL